MNAIGQHILKYYVLKEEVVFSLQPDIEILLGEDRIEFIKNCKGMLKSEFENSLDSFEESLFIKAFNVKDKNNVTAKDILQIMS